MRPPILMLGVAALTVATIGCSNDAIKPASDGGPADAGGPDAADPDAGDAGDPDAGLPFKATFKVASYPNDGGKLFLVPISVNGSAPFDVLLDTGSNGLRVFAEALGGTKVTIGAQALNAEFGGGDVLAGHVATAEVRFGDVATDGPIDLHLVEKFECSAANPSCEFASGSPAPLTSAGVHGILGVSLRPGQPASVYSPFAQLAPPLRSGFVVHAGGLDAKSGEITFGASASTPGFARASFPKAGALPNGLPAWADDRLSVCFSVDGAPVDPPCTEAVFDTGSSLDIFYAKTIAPAAVDMGALAAGVTFEARVASAFDLKFKVGALPTPSVDLVLVDDQQPFAILGVGVFLRQDVLLDQASGQIGWKSF